MSCVDDTGQVRQLECCTDDLIDTWESTGGGCGYTPCADLEGDLCVDWLENKRHCEAEDGSTQEIVCCEGGFWDHWCVPEALEIGKSLKGSETHKLAASGAWADQGTRNTFE